MRKLVLALALVPTLAMAEGPVQPTEFNLKVTPAELEVISSGLGTQPFNTVLPLINKLRQQVMDQQPKPVDKKVDTSADKPIDKPSKQK